LKCREHVRTGHLARDDRGLRERRGHEAFVGAGLAFLMDGLRAGEHREQQEEHREARGEVRVDVEVIRVRGGRVERHGGLRPRVTHPHEHPSPEGELLRIAERFITVQRLEHAAAHRTARRQVGDELLDHGLDNAGLDVARRVQKNAHFRGSAREDAVEQTLGDHDGRRFLAGRDGPPRLLFSRALNVEELVMAEEAGGRFREEPALLGSDQQELDGRYARLAPEREPDDGRHAYGEQQHHDQRVPVTKSHLKVFERYVQSLHSEFRG